MTRAPTSVDIRTAEARYVEAKRNAAESLGRARIALRAAATRPSTLAVVAGGAGLLGFWVALRRRSRARRAAAGANRGSNSGGQLRQLVLSYAMQLAPTLAAQLWTGVQERLARRSVEREQAAREEAEREAALAAGRP